MEIVSLPPPRQKGKISLEECIAGRRSVRAYKNASLSLAHVGQLLWVAQGITGPEKRRAAPSAGALYPLRVALVAGNVQGVPPGVYRYDPYRHQLLPLTCGDKREQFAAEAHGQDCVRNAAAILVFTAFYRRAVRKHGEKGIRCVDMEAGHAAENVLLQAVALGLGAVPVESCGGVELRRILKTGAGEEPLYMVPVGKPDLHP